MVPAMPSGSFFSATRKRMNAGSGYSDRAELTSAYSSVVLRMTLLTWTQRSR